MKKVISIIFFIIIFLIIGSKEAHASSGATYFYGEAIKIEDENISILSNEETIDTTTSKIKNTVLLENSSSKDITTEIVIPLENKELSTTINNLEVLIDNVKVDYYKNNKGEYVVKTKIYANSGKKVEINYNTDNNLKNAKVIKYNLENFGEKIIGKVKVNVIIEEKDIPLIEGIYPGHYKFENNTISVEYYNLKVNTITKNVIVKKQTYNNLMYGREIVLTEDDKKVLSNVDEWLKNGIKIDYEKKYIRFIDEVKANMLNLVNAYAKVCASNNSILDYIIYKQIIKDGKIEILKHDYCEEINNILIYEMVAQKVVYGPEGSGYVHNEERLTGKIICIDFVETEDEKPLYVKKTYSSSKDGFRRAL